MGRGLHLTRNYMAPLIVPKLLSEPSSSDHSHRTITISADNECQPDDQIFTRYLSKNPGGPVTAKKLTAAMIREAVKDMAVEAGFPADRFSSHSLRKGGITQMSALGATEGDKRDSENYAVQ